MKPSAPLAVVLLALTGAPAESMAQTTTEASRAEAKAETGKPKGRVSLVLTELLKKDAGPLPAAPAEREPSPADDEVLTLEKIIVTERPPPDLSKPVMEPKGEKFLRTGTLWEKGRSKVVLKPYKGNATLGFSLDF